MHAEILKIGDDRILYQASGGWGINPGRNNLQAGRENDHSEEMGQWLSRADCALYAAKAAGRDRFCINLD